MPNLQPIPPKMLVVAVVLAIAGCQPGAGSHPVPSVAQIGADLKCSAGDHGFEDPQLGWGFCYPQTWKYIERAQALDAPKGVDLTFDFTCLSGCRTASPGTTTGTNLFGFMIVSTYERGGATDLSSWVASNLAPKSPASPSPQASPTHSAASPSPSPVALPAITWGNAEQAAMLPDGRRIALTPQLVIILDVRSGPLDLESEMASRLGTWRFNV